MIARSELMAEDVWARLAADFADRSYRQTPGFLAANAARRRCRVEYVAVRAGSEVLGVAGVLVRRVPWIGGLAYIPAGPLGRRGESADSGRWTAVLAALADTYVRQRRLVLRVQPPIGPPAWLERIDEASAQAGFSRNSRLLPYRTMLVALEGDVGRIRRSLQQKWRNCLNAAERQGIEVNERVDEDALDAYFRLHEPFEQSKGFRAALPPGFWQRMQASSVGPDRLRIFVASRGDEAVAGVVVAMHGDTAVYLLGASSDAGRAMKASYLLQWRVIEAARREGFRFYDLGGIDPVTNAGVYHFKAGMNGVEVVVPGAYERRPTGWAALWVRSVESLSRLRLSSV